MRVTLAAIGRQKAGPETALVERYLERFGKVGSAVGLDLQSPVIRPESKKAGAADRAAEEAGRIKDGLAPASIRILFDETGSAVNSTEFAARIATLRDDGTRDLAFCLGGPDGHDPAFLRSSAFVVSFGRLTLPHQIARVCVAEQLYRAATILAGHPYHRD